MPTPQIAQPAPYAIEVRAGRKYAWCACGRSANQPWCDGSHRDTGFQPAIYAADTDCTLYFCGCKHTGSAPLCDGTHKSLG